jgi:RimJ/RimL family protein N-acetyltransferase
MPAERLRPVQERDAGVLTRIITDPEVGRYMTFPEVSETIIREWVRTGGDERYLWWAVEVEETGALAGCAGLVLDQFHQSAEIWYLLDRPYWGQGLGTKVARILLERGFMEFGLHRLWAHVVPVNTASWKLLEKIGLRREGESKKNLPIRGEWLDSYLYAILREEYTLENER